MQYMNIIERAIGQMTDNITLVECIAEECEKEKIDFQDMAKWIKKNPSLLLTIEKNAQACKMLKGVIEKLDSIDIQEYF